MATPIERTAVTTIHAGDDHAPERRQIGSRDPSPRQHNGEAPTTLTRREALKAGAASMAFLLSLGHVGPDIARELAHLAEQGPMTGPRLAGILTSQRAGWNALLTQVGPDRMELPGADGEWSVKQVIAHLTWYEGRVVEGAQQVAGTGTFTRTNTGVAALPMDERNARIAGESRDRPLADVLAEADQVFDQLAAILSATPANFLNDPRLVGMPDDVVPWMLVANNSYAHYREHEQAIRAWLDRQSPRR